MNLRGGRILKILQLNFGTWHFQMIYLNNIAIIKALDAEFHIHIFKRQHDQIKEDFRTDKIKDGGKRQKKVKKIFPSPFKKTLLYLKSKAIAFRSKDTWI